MIDGNMGMYVFFSKAWALYTYTDSFIYEQRAFVFKHLDVLKWIGMNGAGDSDSSSSADAHKWLTKYFIAQSTYYRVVEMCSMCLQIAA